MVSKDNAEHYTWGASCDGWHLLKSAELSVIHERMPPGSSEVRHYHNAARQFFFVLAGTVTFDIDGRRERLRLHESVEVAAGIAHQIFNESEQDVEFLVVSCPSSHSDRIVVGARQ